MSANFGKIQVYTGDGKGKTTAALGIMLRAAGHGLKAHMLHFMKGDICYGELEAVKAFPNLKITPMGRAEFVNPQNPDPIDIEWAQKGLKLAENIMKSREKGRDNDLYCDMLVLDEVLVALNYDLLKLEQLLELMARKPLKMEMILTGRGAPPEIIEKADLVTEMAEIKHYYSRGVKSRPGFDH